MLSGKIESSMWYSKLYEHIEGKYNKMLTVVSSKDRILQKCWTFSFRLLRISWSLSKNDFIIHTQVLKGCVSPVLEELSPTSTSNPLRKELRATSAPAGLLRGLVPSKEGFRSSGHTHKLSSLRLSSSSSGSSSSASLPWLLYTADFRVEGISWKYLLTMTSSASSFSLFIQKLSHRL